MEGVVGGKSVSEREETCWNERWLGRGGGEGERARWMEKSGRRRSAKKTCTDQQWARAGARSRWKGVLACKPSTGLLQTLPAVTRLVLPENNPSFIASNKITVRLLCVLHLLLQTFSSSFKKLTPLISLM